MTKKEFSLVLSNSNYKAFMELVKLEKVSVILFLSNTIGKYHLNNWEVLQAPKGFDSQSSKSSNSKRVRFYAFEYVRLLIRELSYKNGFNSERDLVKNLIYTVLVKEGKYVK